MAAAFLAARRWAVDCAAPSPRSISHCRARRDIGVRPHCESSWRISAANALHSFGKVLECQNNCISRATMYSESISDSVHSGTIGDDHARFHQSCTC